MFRQLHLVLSMLVHRDEDLKSEAGASTVKDTIVAITSIFQSIKRSVDVFDAAKSKVRTCWKHLIFSITTGL